MVAIDVLSFSISMSSISATRGQAIDGIEDFQQFLLLLFDGELKIGAHGIGQFPGIVDPDGRDHGLVVQILAKFDVLLKQGGDPADQLLQLRTGFHLEVEGPHYGAEKTFLIGDGNDLGALHPFHQNLDIAVRQLEALHDVDYGADIVDLIGAGFIDGGVVLGGEKYLLVAGHGLFEGAHAGLTAHHERRHHVRKNDDVPNGHHR